MTPEQQVSGENIRYTQDEEAALQALEKEDFQAAFILNCNQSGGNSRHRLRRRKDAAEVDLFLSQTAVRIDRQQDRSGRADRNFDAESKRTGAKL